MGLPAELQAFRRFCAALTLDSGGPFLLEPFQRTMLADYFAGTRETLILLPKKNGKTTLLAALALYHLLATNEAECVVGASSRDQASILFEQAVGFVRRSEGLQERVLVRRGYRELRSRRDSGRVRVLAADADTADGVIPTLALLDEMHRQKSAGLYAVFRDGLGPRGGQMVTISVAGEHEMTALGTMRSAARQLPFQRKTGRHLHARSAEGSYAMHEWALRTTDDSDHIPTVKLANPASWQTRELLAERRASPSTQPWQWMRFTCGLWVATESWWIRGEDWQSVVATDDVELRDGERIAIGFDGSRIGDATALVACRLSDGLVVPLRVWEPSPDPSWEVPAGEVDAAIADTMERYDVVRGYFDPPLWQSEIDGWAREYGDERVLRYHTNRARMMAATERFRTDVVAKRLRHAGSEVLSRHVLNVQVRQVRGGYWLTKSRPTSPDKIDAAVAAVLAYEARADALASTPEPPRSRELIRF